MPLNVKRLLVVAALLGGGAMAAKLALPALVPADAVLAQLTDGLKASGITLAHPAEKTPSVSVGSSIRISVPDVTLTKPQQGTATLGSLDIELPLSALTGGAPQSVVLTDAKLALDAQQSFSAPSTLALLSELPALGYVVAVEHATITHGDTTLATEVSGTLEPLTNGMLAQFKGTARGTGFELTAKQGTPTQQIELAWGGAKLRFDGSRGTQQPPLLQGKIELSVPKPRALMALLQPDKKAAPAPSGEGLDGLAPAAGEPAPAPTTPENDLTLVPQAPSPAGEAPAAVVAETVPELPLTFSANLFARADQLVLKEVALNAGDATLKGEMGGQLSAPYNVQGNLIFDVLDTDVVTRGFGLATDGAWLEPLLEAAHAAHAKGKIAVRANRMQGLLQGTEAAALLEMNDGVLSIQNAQIKAAGESVVGFSGGVAHNPQGIALVGSVVAQGKAFHAFLPAISHVPMTLPEKGFGAFATTASVRVSGEDIRFSDVRAKVDDMVLNAAFIDQFASQDTGIRIAVSNMDADALFSSHVQNALRFLQQGSKGSVQTQILPPYVQQLLLGMKNKYNIYLRAENYRWDGQPRDPLELRMKLSNGLLELEQFKTTVSGADVTAMVRVDIRQSIPTFEANLNLGDLDVQRVANWFGLTSDAPVTTAPAATSVGVGQFWSNRPVAWGALPLADGQMKLTAKRFLHPRFSAEDVALTLKLANEKLTLEQGTGRIFNADVQMRGELNGGALPSWQLAFTLANLQIADAARLLPQLAPVQGRVSLSGSMVTSGATPLTQAQNLKANFALTGIGVQINQMNLDGATDMLRELASVDALKAEMDRVLPLSNTRFDGMEAQLNVVDGQITIPRIMLRSPRFVGIMDGKGSVVDWTLNTTCRFPLSVLRAKQPPEIIFNGTGPVDGTVTTRDDTSLAAYVSQKTANELIQGK